MTTDSRHGWRVVPNLARGLQLTDIDQLWIADITYVHLAEEFAYLAIVLDAYSRKVIGWAMATHLKAELAIAALDQSIAVRRPPPGSVIHHSDRGVQYACAEHAARLAAHRIQPSMSRIGNPCDNAKAERIMRTLKDEEVDGRAYCDIIDAKKSIGEFVERVYNRHRLHSALDYLSPDEYEAGLTRLRQDPPAAMQNLENCP
ncbi:IS3 family transposase [Mesorhizobium sp. M0923]|uniref:IS3 family transposase n=1 Tax=Mesorhizobium sp. M0923 TaxID=2957028 RepID=UPI00333D52A5